MPVNLRRQADSAVVWWRAGYMYCSGAPGSDMMIAGKKNTGTWRKIRENTVS